MSEGKKSSNKQIKVCYYLQLVCYLVKIKLNRSPLVEQIRRDDDK